jgi:hypothetical protein
MADTDDQLPPDKPHRSFVVTDFSVRDIPLALLAYVIISAVCVVFGLAVESLTSFWQGFVFGIAVALAAVGVLSLILRKKDKQ